jgi:hypothetical protein
MNFLSFASEVFSIKRTLPAAGTTGSVYVGLFSPAVLVLGGTHNDVQTDEYMLPSSFQDCHSLSEWSASARYYLVAADSESESRDTVHNT